MRYSIEITSSAQRQFKKFSEILQNHLTTKILTLEIQPRPVGVKKLQSFDYYRIRMADYRIIYSINDKSHTIKILDIGHRKDIYR